MENKQSYTKEAMREIIMQMSSLFDVVRLVDPITMTVYDIDNGEFKQQEYNCFHVWRKNSRCENCVSSRCHMIGERCSKFEFIGDDSYHVVAQKVTVDGRDFVLETVTKTNDNVMLSAFGKSEFAELVNKLNRRVYTDALTGILNRRFIDERYPILVNFLYSETTSLATVMVDADDFKGINDRLGHQNGDEVLKYLAEILNKHFGENKDIIESGDNGDIVARYGGDEFFAAISGMDIEELRQHIKDFQKEIAESEYRLSASIGAYYQSKVNTLDYRSMINHADAALYEAKQKNKGGFCIDIAD